MRDGLVIDSSVIVAVLKHERDAASFREAMTGKRIVIGWPTVLEVKLWVLRRGSLDNFPWFEALLNSTDVEYADFDGEAERLASSAFERFGKGLHPAKLNFGDCMVYAVAKARDLPLLFKGGDFGVTDVRAHPASVLL